MNRYDVNPFESLTKKEKLKIEKLKRKENIKYEKCKRRENIKYEKCKRKSLKQNQKQINLDDKKQRKRQPLEKQVKRIETFLLYFWLFTIAIGAVVIIGVLYSIDILCSGYFIITLSILIVLGIIFQFRCSYLKYQLAHKEIKDMGFVCDKEICVGNYTFMADYKNKKWLLMNKNNIGRFYDFSIVLSYEIYEDGDCVVKGSIGRSLIGGVFFGIMGAIIAGRGKKNIQNNCNSLKLIIRINEIDNPMIELVAIDAPTSKDSSTYKSRVKSLQEICACFEFMINNKTLEEATIIENSQIETKSKKEQLQELKELLDDGLITEEDYNKKKQEILN